ncbi:MAG TPA: transglutaminase domain-containing protein [Planctomicrobium sp.]|nr:transglutaminase domain-containing protein [Planctomicrobium sp.]
MPAVNKPAAPGRKQDWIGIGRLPTMQRTAAVGMILAQNLALKLLMEPVSLPVGAMTLAGWFAPQFGLLLWLPIPISFLPVAAFFVIQGRNSESDFSSMGFIGTEIAFQMASCCLAIQIMVLFLKQYQRRLPIWFLGLSGLGMVLAGDVRVAASSRESMLQITALFLTCWIVFAAASREWVATGRRRGQWIRTIMLVLTVIAGIVAGRTVAVAFHRHENQLERFISSLLFTQEPLQYRHGFSGGGGLQDIAEMKHGGGDEIAFIITSTDRPDYLRGKVFDLFHRNHWHTTGGEGTLVTYSGLIESDKDELLINRFVFRNPEPEAITSFQISPSGRKNRSRCFTPLDMIALECHSDLLKIDSNGILERTDFDGSLDYTIQTGPPEQISIDHVDPKYLQLPRYASPVATGLAATLSQGMSTTEQKINAVAHFFQTEFEYELGIEMPRRVNRLDHFLANRIPAHCEYFATAATILLRLQGIPARYVTGYVVNDKNRYVDEWVVRNRDAHAWVEAYDAERQQWVTVEATPAAGVPSEKSPPLLEEIRDALNFQWRKFLEFLMAPNLWSRFGELVSQNITRLLGTALAISLLYHLFWRLFPRFLESRRAIPLARERLQMDRYLARRGMTRQKSETLLDFARRLEENRRLTTADEMAKWYREYACARFDVTALHAHDEGRDTDRDNTNRHDAEEALLARLRQRRKELILQTKVVS